MRKTPLAYKKGLSFIVLLVVAIAVTTGWIAWRSNQQQNTVLSTSPALQDGVQNDTRSEENRWRLEDMYPSTTAANDDAQRMEGSLQALSATSDQREALTENLKGYFQLQVDIDHLNVYANLLLDSQQDSQEAQTLRAKSESLGGLLAQIEAQLKASFLALSKDAQLRMIDKQDQSDLAQRLSDWQSDAQWHGNVQLSTSLSAFDQLESKLIDPYTSFWKTAKANYNLNDYNSNNDDKRYQATLESQAPEMENRELLASLLEAKVSFDNQRAKAYGYPSALELVLAQDGISLEQFKQLREVVNKSKPIMQRWISLQKSALALERPLMAHDKQLKWYDSQPISYAVAASTLIQSVTPYGENYQQLVKQAIADKWVDVYPRETKSQSEYTWGSYKTHPYVLLQYTDDVYSAATLAHELGHAANNEMSRTHQSFDFATNGTLKAEIAATVNELLLLDALAQNEQPSIAYEAQVESIKSLTNMLFFQMLATEFEIKIHEAEMRGEDLSASYLSDTWKQLIQETYGSDYEVSELDAYGWAHIDHLYWQYYMYKYTLGAAAGLVIEEKLLAGDKSFAEAYVKLLAAGSSEDAIEGFKRLGVDLTSPELMTKAMNSLNQRLEKLEEKSKKNK